MQTLSRAAAMGIDFLEVADDGGRATTEGGAFVVGPLTSQ